LPVRYYDWIAHFGRRKPDKPAVVDLASERRFSYAQFDARISRLAAHLREKHRIARGDRVAVLALNTSDTLEVQFACGRLGAVFLPLNTRLTVPELHRRRCGAFADDPRRGARRYRACGGQTVQGFLDASAWTWWLLRGRDRSCKTARHAGSRDAR
jgi:acyl-CoA synthetase (AMP-forming)/AMP-acid ligase II